MNKGSAKLLALFAILAATLAVGFIASLVTVPNIPGWFETLQKPSFNPPNGLFAPVWTILYVLMAVAAWRVWNKAGWRPLGLYLLQLLANGVWSLTFFGAHAIAAALAEILLLFVLILATMWSFWRCDKVAGLLFLPYAVWVLFAGVLNWAIWRLNG